MTFSIQIERADLLKSLTTISGIVERKNTIPILANVALVAQDGILSVSATDLDIAAKTAAPCDTIRNGTTTVSAAMLLGIIKAAPAGKLISMDDEKQTLTISYGRSKFKLATLPMSDYPQMASDVFTDTFTMPANNLKRLLDKSKYAMSDNELQYYLNGIYFHPTKHGISAVATDGHKMAIVHDAQTQEFPGVIIPRKAVVELVKILDLGDAHISVSETKIRVECGPVTITSKVIDGTFPAYERIIPAQNTKLMIVDATVAAKAAANVSIVSEDKVRAVKLAITEGACVMSVASSINNAEDEIAVEWEDAPLTVGFNSAYFRDTMAQVDGIAQLAFNTENDPVMVSTQGDDSAFWIVMPMRVA